MANFLTKITIKGIDEISKVNKKIGESFKRLESRTKSLSAKFKDVNVATRGFEKNMRNLAIAASAIMSGAGLASMVGKVADLGDELANSSEKLGVSVEALQELRFAAGQSRIEIATLENGMLFLQKAISDGAKAGSKEAKVFKELGISIKDANGNFRAAEDILTDVARKFPDLENGVTRTRTLMTLFGRTAGPEFASLLGQGSDGLDKLREDFRKFGRAITTEESKNQAAPLGARLGELRTAIKGIGTEISFSLMPKYEEMIIKTRDWAAENRGWISSGINDAFSKLSNALKVMAPVIDGLGAAIGYLVNKIGGANIAATAMGGILLWVGIKAVKLIAYPFIDLGRILLRTAGIAKLLALGSLKILGRILLRTAGIAKLLALGSLKILGRILLRTAGIAKLLALGSLKILGRILLRTAGIAKLLALGSLKILGRTLLMTAGIAKILALGSLKILGRTLLMTAGIAKILALGSLKILGRTLLMTAGISKLLALGSLKILGRTLLMTAGISKLLALGSLKILGRTLLMTAGIAKILALGSFAILKSAIIGVGTALKVAFLTNPAILAITAIGVAIAAAAYLIYRNWDWIKEKLGAVINWISNKISGAVNWLSDLFSPLMSFFDSIIDKVKSIGSFFGWSSSGATIAIDKPSAPTRPTVPMPNLAPQSRELDIYMRLVIDQQGRTRVQEFKSSKPIDFEANLGRIAPA